MHRAFDADDERVIDSAYNAMHQLPEFSKRPRHFVDDKLTALVYGEFWHMLTEALHKDFGQPNKREPSET